MENQDRIRIHVTVTMNSRVKKLNSNEGTLLKNMFLISVIKGFQYDVEITSIKSNNVNINYEYRC